MIRRMDSHSIDADIARQFPRAHKLESGTEVIVTPLVPSDWELFDEFAVAIPTRERAFLRREIASRDSIRAWCARLNYERLLPLLAWVGGRIVGAAFIQPIVERSDVQRGHLQLVVHPYYRQRGIGKLMLQEAASAARKMDLDRLACECAVDQFELISLLSQSGFHETCFARGCLLDRYLRVHDLLVLTLNLPSSPEELAHAGQVPELT